MKLEKEITDISMFEKKGITLKIFKEKLLEYKNLYDKFKAWDYEIKNNDIYTEKVCYMPYYLISTLLTLPIFLMGIINNYASVVIGVILANVGITYYIRNLKFGLFKNRYIKWQNLTNDIEETINNQDKLVSLLLETELGLKSLKNNIGENTELKNVIDYATNRIIEELKSSFSNELTTENIFSLIKIIEKIENYETELTKSVKNYNLSKYYIDHKKTQGLIASEEEKQIIENKMVRDFKAIL